MQTTESRCPHDMLTFDGRPTCSPCLGLDDRAALAAAGFTATDFGRPTTTARRRVGVDDEHLADDVVDLTALDTDRAAA